MMLQDRTPHVGGSEQAAAPHPRRELAYRQFRLHPLPVKTGRGESSGNALSPSTYGEREEVDTALKPCSPRVRGGHLLSAVGSDGGILANFWHLALTLLLTLCLATAAHAVEPDEILADKKLEARARHLSTGLRCLVCQNQSIDDSSAPLARDLRLLVRERLQSGETDDQVMRFITDRYGQFVLLNPPVGRNTLLLWATPILLLAASALYWWRRREPAVAMPAGPTAPLSVDEQQRLDKLLSKPTLKP